MAVVQLVRRLAQGRILRAGPVVIGRPFDTTKGYQVVKKTKKQRVRRAYTKAHEKELRAHSRAKTPVARIAKLTKRTVGSLRQKAAQLGIALGHRR
jgi:hypothetical protein